MERYPRAMGLPVLNVRPSAAIVAVALAAGGACAPQIESTPALNLPLPAGSVDAVWATRMLDESERREVLSAFASLPYGEIPPAAAASGERWEDVDRAAREALPRAGAAILAVELDPPEAADVFAASGVTYRLITLGDEPGRLRIERRDGPSPYAAAATVGLLADRGDLSRRILEEFAASMRSFSTKSLPMDAAVGVRASGRSLPVPP